MGGSCVLLNTSSEQALSCSSASDCSTSSCEREGETRKAYDNAYKFNTVSCDDGRCNLDGQPSGSLNPVKNGSSIESICQSLLTDTSAAHTSNPSLYHLPLVVAVALLFQAVY